MRFVDRYAGVPFCWFMGLLYRFIGVFSTVKPHERVKNILVVKFFGLGSIVLATPALTLMKQSFPQARITFLSFHQNKELLERFSAIDKVITVDRSSALRFVTSTFEALRAITSTEPEICFDLEFFSKFSTLLSGFSRARIRVAFQLPTRWRSAIVTHQVPIDKNRHVIHSFCNQVLSVTNHSRELPQVVGPRIDETDHTSLLAKLPIKGKRLIAVNINAGDTYLERRWPVERFSELVSRLADEDDSVFCFTGSIKDSAYVRDAIQRTGRAGRCVDASGKLTIPELGALMQRSDLLISNDSGPLHLASSLGTRTLGLYGPESPEFYGPTHAESQIIYQSLSCSPCMNIYAAKQFRCPHNAQCMREITVEEVFQRVQSQVPVEA